MLKILKLTLAVAILMVSFKPALAELPEDYNREYEGRIIRTPHPDLDIEVWIDKGEGATYYPGEEIYVYFRASRDCYVVIYNLDTRGYVNILYPYGNYDDPWVEGGRVYRIPGGFEDYSLTVDGPSGVEYIQAVASYELLSPPNWPSYSRGVRAEPEGIVTLRMEEDEDPYIFMEWVNHRIRPTYDYATDICQLYVRYPHPRWYYHPDLYWDYPHYFPYHLGSVYIWAPFAVEVYIDGIFWGFAPITIPSMVIGRHYVTIYYDGCRVWDDYVYVERSKTIRVRTNISDRVKYVSKDPVKKDYRNWKEKEYQQVKEMRSARIEKNIGSRPEYTKSKSSRVEEKLIQNQKRDRTEYTAREETMARDRAKTAKNEMVRDREFREKEIKLPVKEYKTEQVSREKSLKSSKTQDRSEKSYREKSSQVTKRNTEVKRTKNSKGK